MHIRLAVAVLGLLGIKRPSDDDLARFIGITKLDRIPLVAQLVMSYAIPWVQFLVDNALRGEHEEKLTLAEFLNSFSDLGYGEK